VYSYEILPEARDQVEGLPSVALIYYAELAKASPSTSSWRTNAASSR
jgi:hypothetical protein